MMDYIEIKFNKNKVLLILFFCIIMILGCIYLLIDAINNYNIIDNSSFYTRNKNFTIIILTAGILFGVFIILMLVRGIYKQPVTYTINDKGIINHTIKGNLFISWKEIKSIYKRKNNLFLFVSYQSVGIDLKNVDAFIARLPKWKQKGVQMSISMGYPPFQITLAGTKYKIDEIITEMNKRMENAKKE